MKRLEEGLKELTVELWIKPQLEAFLQLLQKWNNAYNLTAIKELDEMVVLHILDSLAVAPYLQGNKVLDVGTGAGLPGIPLAMLYPEKEFYLLDSNKKKITFIQQVKMTLGLENIHPVAARVEDYQGEFDTIVSRAFSSLDDFYQLSHHLLAHGGRFVAMKGQKPEAEIKLLKGYVECVELNVPFLEAERCLVIFNQG